MPRKGNVKSFASLWITRGAFGGSGLVSRRSGDLLAEFVDERMEWTGFNGTDLLQSLFDISEYLGGVCQRAEAELRLAGKAIGANFINETEADVDIGLDELQAGLLVSAASMRQKSPKVREVRIG